MKAYDTLSKLKQFQQDTVDAAVELLLHGDSKRVLIADEVGLGKTLVAKGIMAKLIDKRRLDQNKMVIYICSNADIAAQNTRQLKRGLGDFIAETTTQESTRLTRLYHDLQLSLEGNEGNKTRVFPLTPNTSFKIGRATGERRERALIYTIMREHPKIKKQPRSWQRRLETALFFPTRYSGNYFTEAHDNWNYAAQLEVSIIEKRNRHYAKEYAKDIAEWLNAQQGEVAGKRILSFDDILECLDNTRKLAHGKHYTDDRIRNIARDIIQSLRIAFAETSVEKLNPGFVIMDEFQRFSDLVHKKSDNRLADHLVKALIERGDAIPTVLLSATPFKFYATSAEDQLSETTSYDEFIELMNFLSNGNAQFRLAWKDYRKKLEAFAKAQEGDTDEAKLACREAKREVQAIMSRYILRTERESTGEMGELVRDCSLVPPGSTEEFLPSREEILSFQTAAELFRDQHPSSWLAEYSESTPFLLSFMSGYSPMNRIQGEKPKPMLRKMTAGTVNHKRLWLSWKDIHSYSFNPYAQKNGEHYHERFSALLNEVLPNDVPVEQLLWVPPTHQCYTPPSGSPFSIVDKDFSKTIIFSSWRMSPTALACLFSYECERRNVKTLQRYKGASAKAKYFDPKNKLAQDQGRILFKVEAARRSSSGANSGSYNNPADTIPNIVALTYPSPALADIDIPNRFATADTEISLYELFKQIKKEIRKRMPADFKALYKSRTPVDMPRYDWYVAAMMALDDALRDGCADDVLNNLVGGLGKMQDTESDPDDTQDSTNDGDDNTLDNVWNCFDNLTNVHSSYEDELSMTAPRDLYDMLALIAIGSPAVCALRSFAEKGNKHAGSEKAFEAFEFAYAFVKRMNNRAHNLAIRAALVRTSAATFSWEKNRPAKNLLRYCCAGNFQAMLDEYVYLKKNGDELDSDTHQDLIGQAKARVIPILHRSNANYDVNFYDRNSYNSRKRMRSHFATTFKKSDSNDDRANRRVSVRNAFNSPFWPFVLATTSVGQEGLDFHMYCKRIVHWSVPSNPVDLEQREGRINRYDCLAVRKTLYARYAQMVTNEEVEPINRGGDYLWEAIAKRAEQDASKDVHASGLLPHWGIAKKADEGETFYIERVAINYPFSRYALRYENVLKDRALYRLVLGQPNQEVLLRYLQERKEAGIDLSDLFINLSPSRDEE